MKDPKPLGPSVAASRARQSIFSATGERLLVGDWDPRVLASFIREEDVRQARVLDLGCSTGGFSLELARMGGEVVAADPDPYGNALSLSRPILERCAAEEGLRLSLSNADLFSAHRLGQFDVVICFGLLYHFRQPQCVLDYLSSLSPRVLYLSSQTHPGDDLALYNRAHPGVLPTGWLGEVVLSGWHPTRPLLELMLEFAGFGDVQSLTAERFDFPQKPPGATNSAYYRAEHRSPLDPDVELRRYRPR